MAHVAGKYFCTTLALAAAAALLVPAGAQDLAATSHSTPAQNPYSNLTDHEWTDLASGWESLSRAERRWFLTESRKRRSVRRVRGKPAPAIVYRERARFGRVPATPALVPAQANGERAKPAATSERLPDAAEGAMKFGLGFEERQRERAKHGAHVRVGATSRGPVQRTRLARETQAPSAGSGRPNGVAEHQDGPRMSSAP